MLIFNYLKQFWRDMTSQKLRTAMTIFGIVWGTVAVTLLLAFGEGMHHQLRVSQLGLGENIVICWPAQTSKPWQGLPKGRRIRVTDDRLAGWLDDKKVFDVALKGRTISLRPGPIKHCVPLGIANFLSRSAYRKIEMRRLVSDQ